MMIKEICLIAMVAFGLTLAIPGTNVLAQTTLGSHLQSTSLPNYGAYTSNPTQTTLGSHLQSTSLPDHNSPQQNSLGSHLQSTSLPNHGSAIVKGLFIASYIAGIGLVALGIAKLKAHKDNPQQTPLGPPIIK